MNEERLTAEERAVIEAAKAWHADGSGSPEIYRNTCGALMDAVDALRESRKRWRVDERFQGTRYRVAGPDGLSLLAYLHEEPSTDAARRVCDLLNAADKEEP